MVEHKKRILKSVIDGCQYVRKLGPSGLAHYSAYKIREETLTLSLLSISGLGNDMHAPFFCRMLSSTVREMKTTSLGKKSISRSICVGGGAVNNLARE